MPLIHSGDLKRPEPNADVVFRCEQCKGFLNPFCQLLNNRKSFQCNLCGTVQPTPSQFHDPYGDYSDTELSLGSFEFYASDYNKGRPPVEPSYSFLIDVSPSSFASNVPFYAIAAIKETVRANRFNGGRAVSLKVMLFDSHLHLPRFRPDGSVTLSTFRFQTDPDHIPFKVP